MFYVLFRLLVVTLYELCSFFSGDKGIAGQVTVLLKYEYPSIIKEKNKDGVEIKHHAFEWEDYCIMSIPGKYVNQLRTS
jgi:hypothetical protein